MTWCNQTKKEEGASCAWTDAAAHSKKDRENVAAPNVLNLTTIASPGARDNGGSPRKG